VVVGVIVPAPWVREVKWVFVSGGSRHQIGPRGVLGCIRLVRW
jgi:hypothetical protein